MLSERGLRTLVFATRTFDNEFIEKWLCKWDINRLFQETNEYYI